MASCIRTPLPEGAYLHNSTFILDACLGMGGFGITYLARDTALDRPVALKEFFPSACVRSGQNLAPGGQWTTSDLEAYKRKFQEEGRILARLRHPGIVQVYSLFEEHGTVYLVMEFVEGRTLEEYQKAQGGRLSVDEAVGLIRQAGEALTIVHRAGLLHRDLKPANILHRADGQVVLIDFGAAREFLPDRIHSQSVIISRGFAPLEQYKRQGLHGAFTDVYGLAATLYYLVTGEIPIESTFRAVGEFLPSPRDLCSAISETVSEGILRGMSLNAQDRPQRVEAFLALFDGDVKDRFEGDVKTLFAGGVKTRINPIDEAEMIWIPEGEFLMGDADQQYNPRRTVSLSGYWIYKNLVTVKMYKNFCLATGRIMPREPGYFENLNYISVNPNWSKEDHPIVVSWVDAKAYADWAGVSLPTEAQWEKAARGTDGRQYPWGDTFDAGKLWCSKHTFFDSGGTTSVGKYGVSPYGCTDMAGNASQWCSDWNSVDYPKSSPSHNPTGPASGTQHVVRSGGWQSVGGYQNRASFRIPHLPETDGCIGFRCVAML